MSNILCYHLDRTTSSGGRELSSIILNPFRLDALFRAYRLSPKEDGAELEGNHNNIDGFSAHLLD